MPTIYPAMDLLVPLENREVVLEELTDAELRDREERRELEYPGHIILRVFNKPNLSHNTLRAVAMNLGVGVIFIDRL